MKVSTKGRYALRLMLDIAENQSGGAVTIKDISTRQVISEKYLERIVGALVKAGLVIGQRGVAGGYKLVKQPSEYTVKSILDVTENSIAPVACFDTNSEKCGRCDACVTERFWKNLDKVVDDYLSSVTLQNLLDKTCK
jgi:Rrf2 family protein